jgi:hypothetical protein
VLFNWAPRLGGVLESGGIAPRILDLVTRWRRVVSFTPQPLYPQGKNPGNHWIGGWLLSLLLLLLLLLLLDPMAERSKASTVFGHSNTGIVVSNPTWGMDVCPRFSVLCCSVEVEALRRADPPSKESYQLSNRFRAQNWSYTVIIFFPLLWMWGIKYSELGWDFTLSQVLHIYYKKSYNQLHGAESFMRSCQSVMKFRVFS